MNSDAPASSSTASASCATTSAVDATLNAPLPALVPARRGITSRGPTASNAGATPNASRYECDPGRVRRRPQVQRPIDVVRPSGRRRHGIMDPANAIPGQRQRDDAGDEREQHGFGQELTDDARSTRAQAERTAISRRRPAPRARSRFARLRTR